MELKASSGEFLWEGKKNHNVGSKGGFMYYTVCVKYVVNIHANKSRRSSPFSGTESSLSILSFI